MSLHHKWLMISFMLFSLFATTNTFAQTQKSETTPDINQESSFDTMSRRDQARQILLDPQKLIDTCKSYYIPGIEASPWDPLLQIARYLFQSAEVEGDEDFLDTVLMTYIHLGLEELDYNYLMTYSPPKEQLPTDKKLCEDYIHMVAIEAAANINDDELLKQRFEEFRNLENSGVPYILISKIRDTSYVLDQIRRQANRDISPEESTASDHAISYFIQRLYLDPRV